MRVSTAFLSLTLAFTSLGLAPVQDEAIAAAPMAKTLPPGFARFMLGAFEITALNDGTLDLPMDKLLSDKPETSLKKLQSNYLTTPVETSVNAFLVNTGEKLILIDAGAAEFFGTTAGRLLTNLKASGYEAAQIDEIYITHAHPDHLSGLAAKGKVVFPNATLRIDQKDADFWLSQKNLDAAPADSKGFFQGARDAINPYIAAKKFEPFKEGATLASGIRAWATHGHTAGHTSYIIESEGQRLVVLGDLIHVTAVQLDKPELTIAYDSDSKAAAAARKKAFDQLVKDGSLVAAAHISFPGLGRLLKSSNGKGYVWLPKNYSRGL